MTERRWQKTHMHSPQVAGQNGCFSFGNKLASPIAAATLKPDPPYAPRLAHLPNQELP